MTNKRQALQLCSLQLPLEHSRLQVYVITETFVVRDSNKSTYYEGFCFFFFIDDTYNSNFSIHKKQFSKISYQILIVF